MLGTPVLFLIFNRPEVTERVFEAIRQAQPSRLYVAADGPRDGIIGELEKCVKVRQIATQVDWPCELKTLFRDQNLGCRVAVSSAIDWFFENETEGIILEDDCLPHPTFFKFCQELLERYRQDQRIALISGDNFQNGFRRSDDSYYFSRYNHIWGWASWRDRWQGTYDLNITAWPRILEEGRLLDMVGTRRETRFWTKIFEQSYRGEIDTWDYQWTFSCWLHGRVSVLPNVNLVSNLGFGYDATHTTSSSEFENLPTVEMQFPLLHPVSVVADRVLDMYTFRRLFKLSLIRRILKKLSFLFCFVRVK